MTAAEIYQNRSKATPSREVINACMDLVEQYTGLRPYKEQLRAAKLLYKGNIVDMKTGEGKTLAVLLAMLMTVRDGHKVYIVTSNDYLSERDYDYSKPLLRDLGIRSTFFQQGIGGSNEAYRDNQVIYATGETLIFDYLRGIEAVYDFAIIDEIDFILVESANHDFSVSSHETDVKMPEDTFRMCMSIAKVLTVAEKKETVKHIDYLFDMQYQTDVIIDHTKQSAEITEVGFRKIRQILGSDKMEDPVFLEIMQATLLAKYFFLRDVHYIVNDEAMHEGGEIIIINSSNGRMSIGGSNDICIQTAIEIKEGVTVTAKSLLNNTCSYPVFFSVFKTLTGISGTTSYVPYDFSIIYNKAVKKVKEHFPNQRKEIYEYFDSDKERVQYIIDLVNRESDPFLIVSSSDKRSSYIKRVLEEKTQNKNIFILDNHSLENEKALLEEVKAENAVLISSKIVGRGTDIELPDKYEKGLIVVLTERFFSERAERQIIGRTGRNGRKGTCYILTSYDDKLFHLETMEMQIPSKRYVRKLQQKYEQKAFDTRKHIYIRSKLFFDHDKAIRERLNEFTSYEDILDFAKQQEFTDEADVKVKNDAVRILEKAISEGYKFLPMHSKILVKHYEQIRPYFQQQFLRYNDVMAGTLYDNNSFYFRCKEYVEAGKVIVLRVAIIMLSSIMAKAGKTNGVRKG